MQLNFELRESNVFPEGMIALMYFEHMYSCQEGKMPGMVFVYLGCLSLMIKLVKANSCISRPHSFVRGAYRSIKHSYGTMGNRETSSEKLYCVKSWMTFMFYTKA